MSKKSEKWLDNLVYYLTTRRSSLVYLNVGSILCDVCRTQMSEADLVDEGGEGAFLNNDCGSEVYGNQRQSYVCEYYDVCKVHKKSECVLCHSESECTHCITCLNTHVIRVTDDILDLKQPVYKNESVDYYEWTAFDICSYCKYHVCYLYAPNPGFDFRNWSYLDSSRGRVHTSVLLQDW
jgi:hypothetical protein